MKKLLTVAAICLMCADAYGINIWGCYTIPDISYGDPDSTCNTICNIGVCPSSASVSVPTGYTGKVQRGVVLTKNGNGTFSCSCGMTGGTLKCASGYTGTPTYPYVNGRDQFTGCSIPCDGTCDNCESTDWIQNSNGGESRTNATCNTSTCKCSKRIETRCSTGYYGSGMSIVGSTPCTKCPSSGGIAGSSIAGSNKKITDCYIPANTSMTDGTGTYTYTSNCYYSE